MPEHARDRFDDIPRSTGRVGAHRAEQPGMNGWIVLLWSFVAALVLIVVGIFVSLVMMGRITLFAHETPATTPSPGATGIVDTSYTVLVLNATTEQGLDVQLRDTIIEGGWAPESVIYGPAGTQDFPTTTVYYTAEADQFAALGLADVIGGASVVQSDFYADPNNPDQKQLVVVIGLDRTAGGATPTETPAE